MLEIEGADRYRAPIVLEGGSIHVDGEGTVMTTEECLLNPNRNPGLSREQIERVLCDHLGAEKVIWLGRGVFNDETDGHVDNLACFARPGVVLLTWSEDESDPQHAISRDAQERLEAATRRARPLARGDPPALAGADHDHRGGGRGRATRSPGTLPRRAGDRLAASYVNFYLATDAGRLPAARRALDEQAAEVLRDCFPEREIVGVPAREILLGGGNIHCITQQVPGARGASRQVDSRCAFDQVELRCAARRKTVRRRRAQPHRPSRLAPALMNAPSETTNDELGPFTVDAMSQFLQEAARYPLLRPPKSSRSLGASSRATCARRRSSSPTTCAWSCPSPSATRARARRRCST